jgi:uncharacterized protein YgbK (DUF1537 family)
MLLSGCIADDFTGGTVTVADIVQSTAKQSPEQPLLICSSADPEVIKRVQKQMGREQAGAVVGALGVSALEIGREIDPGVPWTRTLAGPTLAPALESGNFGAPDFFLKAWERLA